MLPFQDLSEFLAQPFLAVRFELRKRGIADAQGEFEPGIFIAQTIFALAPVSEITARDSVNPDCRLAECERELSGARQAMIRNLSARGRS